MFKTEFLGQKSIDTLENPHPAMETKNMSKESVVRLT